MTETVIRMPKLADTLVEGTVGRWLKRVGDQVVAGEPLASIETDKVTTELSSPAAGTLLEVLVAAGDTVAVETPIARIGAPSTALSDQPSPQSDPASNEPPIRAEADPLQEGEGVSAVASPRAPSRSAAEVAARKPTPVAARLLAEHGLTARDIPVTGARLTRADVLAHLTRSRQRESSVTALSQMRRAIADHMTRAHETIPHGQTVMAADLTTLFAWREAVKAAFQTNEGANLTFTVLFVRALAGALAHDRRASVAVGIAVALERGLVVPVLRQADQLGLGQTARSVADLATRARAGKLTVDDMQGATMSLTNVGSFGNLTAAPIIPLGQLGILAPGLIERRPLPTADGGVRPGWQCLMALMFDRRELDDFSADRLLGEVVSRLMAVPELV